MRKDNRRSRLVRALESGKTLSFDAPFLDESGESGTIQISVWQYDGNIRFNIERYLDRHALCESLYLEDTLEDVTSLHDFETTICKKYEIGIDEFHVMP